VGGTVAGDRPEGLQGASYGAIMKVQYSNSVHSNCSYLEPDGKPLPSIKFIQTSHPVLVQSARSL